MISKAQIKFIRLLHQKKYRKAHQLFIAEGTKIAHDILNSQMKVNNLYATPGWFIKNKHLLPANTPAFYHEIQEESLEMISCLTTPQEVLLVVKTPENIYQNEIEGQLTLAADGIRDPGNLGTLIRICDWYGIKQLFCSEDCAEAWNPKTVQATMGSIARVKIIYTDLKSFITTHKDYKSYSATLDGEINIHEANLSGQTILIIGNEAHGISNEILEIADNTVKIPGFGKAESLNASIAAAILIDNLKRMEKSNIQS